MAAKCIRINVLSDFQRQFGEEDGLRLRGTVYDCRVITGTRMRSRKALLPNIRLFTVMLLLSPFLVGYDAIGTSLEERRKEPGSTRDHAVSKMLQQGESVYGEGCKEKSRRYSLR
jgi:hypothetical protein